MRGSMTFWRKAMACACAGAIALPAVPAAALGSYSPYNETATAALARYVRDLTENPKDFATLVNAGRAALGVGDTSAAAGFFARADELDPSNPQPHAGMGAVAAANNEPNAAIPYFTRAMQLGAKVSEFGADRGLAYDLMGMQAQAQADYRSAMGGADRDSARARLALSLAISGNRAEAMAALAPLQAKGDPAGARARAFVLALTGDVPGAVRAIELSMPGSSATIAPFLSRLAGLNAGQKAAAVNLGIFPVDNAAPYTSQQIASADRLGEVAQAQVAESATTTLPAASAIVQAPMVQASRQLPDPQTSYAGPPKFWLQLATASDRPSVERKFENMKSRYSRMFDGIRGYVAPDGDRSRLLIGPFRNAADADTFAADLESVRIGSFKWRNSDSDLITPIGL